MKNNAYLIKQISIFSENKPGKLAHVAKVFQDANVNMMSFSIAEAEGFGVIRALVDKPEMAFSSLSKKGIHVAYTDVIAVRMKNQPGGLYEVAAALAEAAVNIEYSYAFAGCHQATLILRVDDIDAAIDIIQKSGAYVLKPEELLCPCE
ncbi:MAG: acetolactate synthase [Methanomicrobiales archaeon]|jgi:hypothetical protein|nr:acetolactate synthase [Methanomicrobiales archaeon]